VTNGLLLLIALLAGIKILLRKDGEFFLASVDVLLLGLSIFLAVTLRSLADPGPLAGAFIKGIVLFLGVKVVTIGSRRHARTIVFGMLAVLVAIIVGGMV